MVVDSVDEKLVSKQKIKHIAGIRNKNIAGKY